MSLPPNSSVAESDNSGNPPAQGSQCRGLTDELLERLAKALHNGTADERQEAMRVLHAETKKLVCHHIQRMRNPRYRQELDTSWLANGIEKSYLSYISKEQWKEQPPDCRKLRAILKTIASRVIIRELRPVMKRPAVEELDFFANALADPRDLSESNADIDDFLESLKEVVREEGACATSVLVAKFEQRSRTEVCHELNLSRGKYDRILRKLRRKALEFYLDQNWPGSRPVLIQMEQGRSAQRIAESLKVELAWVSQIMAFIRSCTDRDAGVDDVA